MKSLIKFLVRQFSKTQIGRVSFQWLDVVSRMLGRVATFALTDPDEEIERVNRIIRARFPELRVAHGPFEGMRYPDLTLVWGSPFPKLLGSYEAELAPLIEGMNEYSEIIDIGCAEGYYAVGMAMRNPRAKVHAFDTSLPARAFCQRMAELNEVADRIEIGTFCDETVLLSIALSKKALIVSDCEGYEKVLFSERVVSHLAKHDLLIEVHDCLDIEISAVLRHRFSATHHITAIESIDDIRKAQTYCYPELEGFALEERRTLVGERRDSMMEWFFMTPCTV